MIGMVSCRTLIAVLLAGCGRIAFEAADVPDGACVDGHDEDSDGVPDGCDVCPQVADAEQADGDGDGVGDACDPGPEAQQLVFFDPFLEARSEWRFDDRMMFLGDSVMLPGANANMAMQLLGRPDRSVLEVAGRAIGGGDASRQIAIHIGEQAGEQNYYCELYDGSGRLDLMLTYTRDGVDFENIAIAQIGGLFETATFRLAFEHTPPDLRCVAFWNGTRYEVKGADPGGIPLEAVYIAVSNADAELTSFVKLATP